MTPMSATFEEMIEALRKASFELGASADDMTIDLNPIGERVRAAKAALLKYDADLRALLKLAAAEFCSMRCPSTGVADHPIPHLPECNQMQDELKRIKELEGR